MERQNARIRAKRCMCDLSSTTLPSFLHHFVDSLSSYKVMQMFKGCRREDTAPHIYSMAQAAYRNLLTTRQDQSIVLLGKSGSGKTTNCQHIIQYLLTIAGSTNKTFSSRFEKDPNPKLKGFWILCNYDVVDISLRWILLFSLSSVAEKWQAVYTVLEAFGNASTCMNGSASRFSHIVSLDFDQAGLVTSASIQVLMYLCIEVAQKIIL